MRLVIISDLHKNFNFHIPNGDILITGRFAGTVDFDPGLGVDIHVAQGAEDIYVTKL